MNRKPLVTLQSIKRAHELRTINKIVVRPGSKFLTKLQTTTSKKL